MLLRANHETKSRYPTSWGWGGGGSHPNQPFLHRPAGGRLPLPSPGSSPPAVASPQSKLDPRDPNPTWPPRRRGSPERPRRGWVSGRRPAVQRRGDGTPHGMADPQLIRTPGERRAGATPRIGRCGGPLRGCLPRGGKPNPVEGGPEMRWAEHQGIRGGPEAWRVGHCGSLELYGSSLGRTPLGGGDPQVQRAERQGVAGFVQQEGLGHTPGIGPPRR